jgi:TetR/AcrR family transcriptional regulator, cholesterol catabolism regulator
MPETLIISHRIKEKAHELFLQYGLRSVSMDDIANALGISKKTIYQYYSDKDALVDEVMTAVFEHDQVCCENDKAKADNAVHEIFLAIDFIVELFKSMNPSVLYDLQKFYPTTYARFVQHKDNFLYHIIVDNITRGKKEALYRPEIHTEIIARYRVESMLLPFNPSFQTKLKNSLAQVEEELTLHFLFGLLTPKGHKVALKYLQKTKTK